MEKTIYPKTARIKNEAVIITEKLDGSNLGIFNLSGELIIAQRNHIFKLSELTKGDAYKGLIGWLEDNKDSLDFCEGSGVFGEWIVKGQISYGESLGEKFHIFAKANIDDEYEIRNLNYNRDLFKYPFVKQEVPSCIGIVPLIESNGETSIESLNLLYEFYTKKVNRKVEGFVINNSNQITKYVRYKDGKPSNHKS